MYIFKTLKKGDHLKKDTYNKGNNYSVIGQSEVLRFICNN